MTSPLNCLTVLVAGWCFVLVVLVAPTNAQQTLSPTAILALDSAAALIGWTRDDFEVPSDFLQRDQFRTAFHDMLFSAPLRVLDELEYTARDLRGGNDEDQERAFDRLVTALGYDAFRRKPYELQVTTKETVRRLGVDPDAYSRFIGSTLLYRFLGTIIAARDDTRRHSTAFRRSDLVFALSDSLWSSSSDVETSSLWELATDEERDRIRSQAFFDAAILPGSSEAMTAGLSLYLQLLNAVKALQGSNDLLADSVTTVEFETALGRVALGGPGNDTYIGRYAFILDVGGNDTYVINDGSKVRAADHPISVILDLAGDDTYRGGKFAFGAGIGGTSILIDVAGNDLYDAGDFSLGCGLFGVGVLHDLSGNDTYLGGQNTQGAGIFGIGILRDDSGFDTYRAHAQAQGFGGTRGCGVLHDRAGNDVYLAVSPYTDVLRYESHQVTFTQGAALGQRPIASGGIGLLIDDAGNDTYSCDIYGQGTAYWFGAGALFDKEGEDRYQAYQYAQGSGVHFANGYLRDSKGDDVYVSHGVSQGCGHDVATGILLDEEGNDAYVAESLSLGSGNANGISILLDLQGNDMYSGANRATTFGFSDFRRMYGMVGLFIDAGGTDTYNELLRNGTSSLKSTYGVFLDLELGASTPITSTNPPPRYVEMPLAESVDSLLVQASAAPLRFQNNVSLARKKLAEMDENAVDSLRRHLGTQMPRLRLALEEILPKLYERFPDTVMSLLRDSIESSRLVVATMCATVVGKAKILDLRSSVVELLSSSDWRVRRLGLHTLGEMDDTSSLEIMGSYLHDRHPYVVARAAYHIGRLSPAAPFTLLQPALEDRRQIVRYAAIEGLLRGPRIPIGAAISLWNKRNDLWYRASALRLLAVCDATSGNVDTLRVWLEAASPVEREAFFRLAATLPAFWQTALTSNTPLPSPARPATKKKRKRAKATPPLAP